jgi:hypothetical protein
MKLRRVFSWRGLQAADFSGGISCEFCFFQALEPLADYPFTAMACIAPGKKSRVPLDTNP